MAPSPPRPHPPAHTLRLTVGSVYGGQPCANVFWLRNPNPVVPSQAGFDAFMATIASSFANNMTDHTSVGITFNSWQALYYGPVEIDLAGSGSLAITGEDASAALPANVAACISWKVQQHYKGGHPRTYVAGIGSSAIALPTRFQAAYTTALADSANQFHRDCSASSTTDFPSSLRLGVVSFVLRNEWRSPPVFRDFVPEGARVDERIDSMRRRLGRDIP